MTMKSLRGICLAFVEIANLVATNRARIGTAGGMGWLIQEDIQWMTPCAN
jgi:hypothetical protein